MSENLGAVGRRGFSRGGRRGRPQVGHEVAERHVRFVSDRRDDGHRHRGDGARHALAIERPEIFDRATAPRHDQDVDRQPADPVERGAHRCFGLCALDLRGDDDQLGDGPTASDHGLDVTQHRAVGTGDDGNTAREFRHGALAARIEQTILQQRGLRLLERELPQSTLLGGEQLHHRELELALFFVHRGSREHEHLHAIDRRRRQHVVLLRKHHAADLCRCVAQREVPVTTAPGLEPGDFAPHPQRWQARFDDSPGPARHLADGPSAFRRRSREQI